MQLAIYVVYYMSIQYACTHGNYKTAWVVRNTIILAVRQKLSSMYIHLLMLDII